MIKETILNDFVDVYLEGDWHNPTPMTRTRYTHPSLGENEYVRLFKDSEFGLVYRESGDGVDYLIGLWAVRKNR